MLVLLGVLEQGGSFCPLTFENALPAVLVSFKCTDLSYWSLNISLALHRVVRGLDVGCRPVCLYLYVEPIVNAPSRISSMNACLRLSQTSMRVDWLFGGYSCQRRLHAFPIGFSHLTVDVKRILSPTVVMVFCCWVLFFFFCYSPPPSPLFYNVYYTVIRTSSTSWRANFC